MDAFLPEKKKKSGKKRKKTLRKRGLRPSNSYNQAFRTDPIIPF
jgi:hypothetical protein